MHEQRRIRAVIAHEVLKQVGLIVNSSQQEWPLPAVALSGDPYNFSYTDRGFQKFFGHRTDEMLQHANEVANFVLHKLATYNGKRSSLRFAENINGDRRNQFMPNAVFLTDDAVHIFDMKYTQGYKYDYAKLAQKYVDNKRKRRDKIHVYFCFPLLRRDGVMTYLTKCYNFSDFKQPEKETCPV